MTTKLKKAAAASTKDAKDSKESKAAPGKKSGAGDRVEKMGAKASAAAMTAPKDDDSEASEEALEEAEDTKAAASSNAGGNAAALAAAGTTEMSASFKNFRHHPDMENFYRFIFDNDLRHEALQIIDEIQREKHARKLLKGAKNQAH